MSVAKNLKNPRKTAVPLVSVWCRMTLGGHKKIIHVIACLNKLSVLCNMRDTSIPI